MIQKEEKNVSVLSNNKMCYTVLEVEGVFDPQNNCLKEQIGDNNCLVVTSFNVYENYAERIQNYFDLHYEGHYHLIQIDDKEQNKNIDSISNILESAKSMKLDRKGLMIAIGGGIIMDMVGFAASMYRRKVEYIRIPTTLIGYVDAGIGIKTGINFHDSKNFVGAFYPPKVCINDYSFLKTLNSEEIKNGISEILKMGIITDYKLFCIVENNIHEIMNTKCLCEGGKNAIYSSIYDMLVELDKNFYEDNLERLVDFGHTFSPFIETDSDYLIPHGHAVALDIAISTELSYELGYIDTSSRNRILELLLKTGLSIFNFDTFKPFEMAKSLDNIILHRGGELNLVLPMCIGKAFFYKGIIEDVLLKKVFSNLKKIQEEYGKA